MKFPSHPFFLLCIFLQGSSACGFEKRKEDSAEQSPKNQPSNTPDVVPSDTHDKDKEIPILPKDPLKNLIVLDDIKNTNRLDFMLPSKIEDLGSICKASGGDWNRNLYTCNCEQNKLFSPRLGCAGIEISPKGMLCLEEGLENILKNKGEAEFNLCLEKMFPVEAYLKFDESKWSKASLDRKLEIAQMIDRDGFEFLRGEYDLKDQNYRNPLNPTINDYLKHRIVPDQLPESSIARTLTFMSVQPPSPEGNLIRIFHVPVGKRKELDLDSCSILLTGLLEDIEESKKIDACSSLVSFLEKIRKEKFKFDQVYDTTECAFCGLNNFKIIGKNTDISYSILLRNFFVLDRIAFITGHGFKITLILSNSGSIDSVKFYFDDEASAQKDGFLRGYKSLAYDRSFSNPQTNRKNDLDLEKLWNKLTQKKLAPKLSKNAIRLHLINSNYDIDFGIFENLYVNQERLAEIPTIYERNSFLKFLKKKAIFEEHFDDWTYNMPQSILRTFISGSRSETHSNLMVETFMSGVKNASISVSSNLTTPRFGVDSSSEFLKRNNIKVVSSVETSEKLFPEHMDQIITRNSDVVFIFAAGNFGTNNYVSDPPWSATEKEYPNVIVATMFDPNSPRKVDGNSGRAATVAVPIEDLKEGTSYSSAKVGNLVAKLRQKFPALTAREIVSLVHKNLHIVEGLQVRTGGVVNFDLDVYSSI